MTLLEMKLKFFRDNILPSYIDEVMKKLEIEELVTKKKQEKYLLLQRLKNDPNYKLCKDCNTYKKLSEFYKNPLKKQGVFDYCKKCAREKAREKNASNRERKRSFKNALLTQ